MAKWHKTKVRKRRSGGARFLRGLLIVVTAFSLVIVAGFIALHFWAPDVDDQVVFRPDVIDDTDQEDDPPVESDAPDADDTPAPDTDEVVLHRRDGVYTCLLIGSADMGGTDTMMLGVFDTGNKTASLLSIPRDSAVRVNGSIYKMNAVQSLGGTELLADTISSTLAVPVDFYVEVDTNAFKAIVDEIGGVYFDVPVDMNYDDPLQNLHIHISKGYQKLDGSSALGVMRCRNCYPNADIGRTETQRKFLAALVKQTITPSNVTKVTALINILNTYVDSDMKTGEMVWFATQAIGMDLDAALNTCVLDGEWVSPYYVLDGQKALETVNSLGIYEEEVPSGILNICRP